MPETIILDESYLQFCTPVQAETLTAYLSAGGNVSKAARDRGVRRTVIQATLRRIKEKAAARGYAPDHQITFTAPEGYVVKGHSTLERIKGDDREVILQWTKTSADMMARAEALEAALQMAGESLPRLKPEKAPAHTAQQLCNFLTVSDYHIGMAARAAETGGDWDLQIAEDMLMAATHNLLSRAPKAKTLVLNIQGDFLHFDSQRPVTPTHGHVLDAAGSFTHMAEVVIRVLRQVISLGLQTHDEVHLIMCQGNHDLASMVLLRHAFTAIYENEPRLTVNQSHTPYYVYEFGKVMLGVHHGHMKPNAQLPMLFATRYSEIWGRTQFRYAHCGHRHHRDEKEQPGMDVIQHPTLAPADKHASDGGWDSTRRAFLVTYHSDFGEYSREIFTPEMVDLKVAS